MEARRIRSLGKDHTGTLADSTGKRNPNTTFEGEIVLCHVLPCLLFNFKLFTEDDIAQLDTTMPLVVIFLNLCRRYSTVDTSLVRGYNMYKNLKKISTTKETNLYLLLCSNIGFTLKRQCNILEVHI